MYNMYGKLLLFNGLDQQRCASVYEPNINSQNFLRMIAGIELARGNHWENWHYNDKAGKGATGTTQGTSLTDIFEKSKGLPPQWHNHRKTILTTTSAGVKAAKLLWESWAPRITAGSPGGFDPKGGEEYV